MFVTLYPSIKELINPNPYSNNVLNEKSFKNFEDANVIAKRLVNDIAT